MSPTSYSPPKLSLLHFLFFGLVVFSLSAFNNMAFSLFLFSLHAKLRHLDSILQGKELSGQLLLHTKLDFSHFERPGVC